MKFGLNDVFDSFEVACDTKKVLFEFSGLVLALAGYFLISWLGVFSANVNVAVTFQIVSLIYFYIVAVLLAGSMSHICYKHLTSGERVSAGGAISFGLKHAWALILAPVFLVVSALVVLGIEYVIFMLARLPYIPVVLSLLTLPFVLVNAAVILALAIGGLLISAVVASDETGPVATVKKILDICAKAPLQVLLSLALVTLIMAPVLAALFGAVAGAIIMTLSLFGSASGVFIEMASTEIPTLTSAMYAAWGIFMLFAMLAVLALAAFKLVVLKAAMVSAYLKIKELLK